MNFSTWRRSHLLCLWALMMWAFAGSVSSCQSAKQSFSFQPAPRLREAAPEKHQAEATPPQVIAAAPMVVASREQKSVTLAVRLKNRSVRTGLRRSERIQTTSVPYHQIARGRVQHQRHLFARPAAPAERGLGTTVLGVLGLIALPIALVGLILSGGGLVWAIIAGAAALAVLVAYLDPFGH